MSCSLFRCWWEAATKNENPASNSSQSPFCSVSWSFGALGVGPKRKAQVQSASREQQWGQDIVGCGAAKSHQDVNLSCMHRVNSQHTEPPFSPSQTSYTYQRFSGNCTEPRKTRKSIPHSMPGPQEQMGFIIALLSALHRADCSTTRGHSDGISHLPAWQPWGPSSPRCPTHCSHMQCTLSAGSVPAARAAAAPWT